MYKAKMPNAWVRIKWCEQQFGTIDEYGHPWVRGARWWRNKGYVCFRDEADYLFYLLRWA